MPKDSLILWGGVEDPEDFINKCKGIANDYLLINKKNTNDANYIENQIYVI